MDDESDRHHLAMERLCYLCANSIKIRPQKIVGKVLENLVYVYGNKILELEIIRGVAPKRMCFSCHNSVKKLENDKRNKGSFKTSKGPRRLVL